jgi:hypothetical protein
MPLDASRDLVIAVKLHRERAWRLARHADLPPATVSRIVTGVEKLRENDERVLRLADVVGVPREKAFARRAWR